MSTAPESTPPPAAPHRDLPIGLGFMPGNAELVIWIIALFVAMIVCWVADNLDSSSWLQFFTFTTVAYILSRGIAKASRVLEY